MICFSEFYHWCWLATSNWHTLYACILNFLVLYTWKKLLFIFFQCTGYRIPSRSKWKSENLILSIRNDFVTKNNIDWRRADDEKPDMSMFSVKSDSLILYTANVLWLIAKYRICGELSILVKLTTSVSRVHASKGLPFLTRIRKQSESKKEKGTG